MPEARPNPHTLYAAVILAALVAVIVVARRRTEVYSVPSNAALRRVEPKSIVANSRPNGAEQSSVLHEPPPLPKVATGREVLAGFPEDESDDIGPIKGEPGSIYSPVDEAPEEPAPVVVEGEKQPAVPAQSMTRITRPADGESLRPVLQQAAILNRQAESLARRGAYYLARNLTIQSLRTIAEALDLQSGSGEHTAALASALTALREAADFQSRSSEDSTVSVPLVVSGHKTPILRQHAEGLSAIAAQERYLDFAREQLVIAAGGQPVASHALGNLGKLQARMDNSAGQQQTNLARAIVYEQAALDVDRRNYPAANELGSLLLRFGHLREARRILLHSVGTMSNPEGWQTLATVHDRLGEAELAEHAHKQLELLTGGSAPKPKVEWVTPEVFAGNQPAASAKSPSTVATSKSPARSADSRPATTQSWLAPFGIKR